MSALSLHCDLYLEFYSYLTEQTCMILRLIDDLEEKLDSFILILFKTFILFQNLV